MTVNDRTGQFVLHVPSEYDYLFTATHCGISAQARPASSRRPSCAHPIFSLQEPPPPGGALVPTGSQPAPATGIIDALQAYTLVPYLGARRGEASLTHRRASAVAAQAAYTRHWRGTQHLPVRTFSGEGDIVAMVQRKARPLSDTWITCFAHLAVPIYPPDVHSVRPQGHSAHGESEPGALGYAGALDYDDDDDDDDT